MNRREFTQGVVGIPMLKAGEWRHHEAYKLEWSAYYQGWFREDKGKTWVYARLTEERWDSYSPNIQQFYTDDRDYNWEHRREASYKDTTPA